MDTTKLLKEIKGMRLLAEMLITKASMLEHALSGVVSDSAPQKGLEKKKTAVLSKRALKRITPTNKYQS